MHDPHHNRPASTLSTWLLATALMLFALPVHLHTCLGSDSADCSSCCTTTTDTATCCTGNDLPADAAPTCCYTTTDLPTALPIPARDHAQPTPDPAVVANPSLVTIAHRSAPGFPPFATPPASGTKRHLVLCQMLI